MDIDEFLLERKRIGIRKRIVQFPALFTLGNPRDLAAKLAHPSRPLFSAKRLPNKLIPRLARHATPALFPSERLILETIAAGKRQETSTGSAPGLDGAKNCTISQEVDGSFPRILLAPPIPGIRHLLFSHFHEDTVNTSHDKEVAPKPILQILILTESRGANSPQRGFTE